MSRNKHEKEKLYIFKEVSTQYRYRLIMSNKIGWLEITRG